MCIFCLRLCFRTRPHALARSIFITTFALENDRAAPSKQHSYDRKHQKHYTMKKIFLLFSVLVLSMLTWASKPVIAIDGDKSDWAEVPMLSQPGTWPMLKVLPAADAELGTNALAFMVENTIDFDNTWVTYTTEFIDKDYDVATRDNASVGEGGYNWQYTSMGVDYKATTGVTIGSNWVSFSKAMSANNKVVEIAIPASWLVDLGSKFGFALFYGNGSWYCPEYNSSGHPEISDRKGFLYKTRSFTTLPGTIMASNAFAHPTMGECTNYVDFGMRDDGNDTARWAAFPIEINEPAMYDVSVNVSSTNDWSFEFWVYGIANNDSVAHLEKAGGSSSDVTKNLGRIDLTALTPGKYMLKVKNKTRNSAVKLNSITLTYAGGAVVDISPSANTTLNVADALFSSTCTRDADGITYPSSSTADAWIKWNISTSETRFYDVTVNINTTQAHGFTVAVYEDEEASPVASITEGTYVNTSGSPLALELGRINLVGGKNYIVKVTNITSGSQAEVLSVLFAPVVASATVLPGTLAFSNAVLSARAHITGGNLYFAPTGDTNPAGEWARWAVTTDHNGLFLFTMNVNSDNSQSYKISIYNDSEVLVDSYEAKPGSGAQTITHYFELATGNYSIKVENTTAWSHGYLTSFGVTEPAGVVTLNENATDNTAWTVSETSYTVQIIRTLKAGMYNTFCLPFAVNSAMCNDIFGADVEIYTLESATVEDDYVLNLNMKAASDMYQGTPVLIKPSRDIVNPVFEGVVFISATPATSTATNANFVGTFVKSELTADPNILFLGANNTLYFPTATIDILGMRAYFMVHDAPANAIKRARIVESGQVATEIELVNTSQPAAKNRKMLLNGQLVIIRDGVQYNAMGARLK